MYNVSLEEAVELVLAIGGHNTVLVEGHMGTGKSSLLNTLAEKLPSHLPVYFDCTTKDLGDIMVPNIVGDAAAARDYVTFSPNEEFGLHHGKPVILMLDEIGKANNAVKQGLTRLMLERTVGSRSLPEGSIVFATTNLGAENVGDMFAAHQLNRLVRVTLRKPDAMEWIGWAMNNNIEPIVAAWVRDNPQVFQTFEDCRAVDNPYIFHPQEKRAAFVTPRSLETASKILHRRDAITTNALTAALIGAVGARAGVELVAFTELASQMPSLDSIKKSPDKATVPESAAATMMVVFRTLSNISSEWVDAWMAYMRRLPTEAQAVFCNGVREKGYKMQSVVMTNAKFQTWVRDNRHLFGADQ